MEKIKTKASCNLCGGENLIEILDLGEMPISNAFLKQEQLSSIEDQFPLAVQLCQSCYSLQLKHAVSSELIFNNYNYETGASKPLVEHFAHLAYEIANEHCENAEDLVVEVGSNDGSLLAVIKDKVKVLGIDPAHNIARSAIDRGVPTIVGFFDLNLSKQIVSKHGKAKVIVANNVMAHIDDLKSVFLGTKELLAQNGKFIFEVHWVGNLLTEGGFDQIYHEHFYYHSLNSLKRFVESIGMFVNDVKMVPIHGQSIRVYTGFSQVESENVRELLRRENDMGLNNVKTYHDFTSKVESGRKELVSLLKKLKDGGKKIVGYGAPAKGNTLLNYFKIGPDVVDYITDTTPSKQGMYTPGSRIRIVSPDFIKNDIPDFVLLLSWNYADSILEKEKELRDKGVKFIIPVPIVKVV